MMKKNTTDGFVSRQPGRIIGNDLDRVNAPEASVTGISRRPIIGSRSSNHVSTQKPIGVASKDIEESLKNISDFGEEKGSKKRKKRIKAKKVDRKGGSLNRKKKIVKIFVIVLIVIVLAVGGWIMYKGAKMTGNIFGGNIFDILQNHPLKEDENGRSNILVVGTSQDDPGHEAGYLTDSIMVLSIDQDKKDAYMVSIPRDLEVQYGQACLPGFQGKINAYYNCVGGGNGDRKADDVALTKTAKFIGDIVGLDVQYGVNVNYTVMREIVDAIGGEITVTIESRNPNGQMDSNFDWKCGVGDPKVSYAETLRRCPPNGHFIDYPNGEVKLDSEHALYLAQARGDRVPTYGFEQSNFDREKNQQKIVRAILEKATSVGVLSNPSKVVALVDALGNNLNTTFEANEILTLISIAKDTKPEDIKSISLVDGDTPVMGGDAQPVAGKYQFEALRSLIRKKLSSSEVVREEAKVVIMNGSGIAGAAQAEADELTAKGFTIFGVENAPDGDYKKTEIYQIKTGKDSTKKQLESIYGVNTKTEGAPAVASEVNFVVIIGKDNSQDDR